MQLSLQIYNLPQPLKDKLMAKESVLLQIRLSPKLKQQFEQLCDESEISMSNKVRELIANLVKNNNRKSGRTTQIEDN